MAIKSSDSITKLPPPDAGDDDDDDVTADSARGESPLRYVPLCEVYSATSPRVTASGSKKVKPPNFKPKLRKLVRNFDHRDCVKGVVSGNEVGSVGVGRVENVDVANGDGFDSVMRDVVEEGGIGVEDGKDFGSIAGGQLEKEDVNSNIENGKDFELIIRGELEEGEGEDIDINGGIGNEDEKDFGSIAGGQLEKKEEDVDSNSENGNDMDSIMRGEVEEGEGEDINRNGGISVENGKDFDSIAGGQLEKEEDVDSNIESGNDVDSIMRGELEDREGEGEDINSNGGIGIENGKDVDLVAGGQLEKKDGEDIDRNGGIGIENGNVSDSIMRVQLEEEDVNNGGIGIEKGDGFDSIMRGQLEKEEELVFQISRPVSRVYVRRRKKKPDFVEMLRLGVVGGVSFDEIRVSERKFEEGSDKEMAVKKKDKLEKSEEEGNFIRPGCSDCGEEKVGELTGKKRKNEMALSALEMENLDGEQGGECRKKKKRLANHELANLGVALDTEKDLNTSRLRENRCNLSKTGNSNSKINKKLKNGAFVENPWKMKSPVCQRTKRWAWLRFDGADPRKFIGLQCKVYWPLDGDWYCGRVTDYKLETGRHHVEYEDGDVENVILANERVKFHISPEEMQCLKLTSGDRSLEADGLDVNELLVLAASLDDSQDFEPGDIIWAKITGHAMWPATILDESVAQRKGLNKTSGEKSVLVQFFGTHDFARVKTKQVIPFLRGLLSSFHQKCKKSNFIRSLEEAKMYLSEQKLPKRMLSLRNGFDPDLYDSEDGEGKDAADSKEDCVGSDDGGAGLDSVLHILNLKKSLKSKHSSKGSKLVSSRHQELPVGYRAVCVKWKDIDKCNVCHMDEEYVNNIFLQCDKCRMMVHARCYGELEPVDGDVWLCNLCRPGAPEGPPPCCLCPFVGGAMKSTTDGRWAHLACAIWIPETCFLDIKRMEPIDGLNRINKDRWKLLCSICGVSYGACIQCSNNNCRVAYHPLCARAAGFCVELEDEGRLHLMSFEEDEENQCIQLLSFCKRHRPLSNGRLIKDGRNAQKAIENLDYTPPSNPSGSARCEPYNYAGRRGRKEPEALAAAPLKRLYVENMPHLVGGPIQHGAPLNMVSAKTTADSKALIDLQNLRNSHLNTSMSILSMTEKYKFMRGTFKKRLAFGKSRIHGFGIFAKVPHIAGDMMIEYAGELVRPPVADRREHLIYNSLVGAGTYMFRIDDERVIDATRAGSIAHLINHSCEPNCYSRVISVSGDEHIIIFAKRDIKQWEELTYDYRFLSIDEQLACYCGFPRCRGVVNDTEAEERAVKLHALRDELVEWDGQ